jgi:plasmid stability protein
MLDATVADMASLQIRNIPEDVHRELKVRAAAAGQSLSDYALEILIQRTKYPPIAEVLERAGRRGTDTVKPHDVVAWIREARGPLPYEDDDRR